MPPCPMPPCPMPPHIIHPQSHATLPHVSLPHVSPLHSPAPCIPMPPSPMPPCPMPPCPMHPHATQPHATQPHATLPHATLPHATPPHATLPHVSPSHSPAPCIPMPPCPMPPCPMPPSPMPPSPMPPSPMPPSPMPPCPMYPHPTPLPHATPHNPSPVPCHPAPCISTPLPCPMHPHATQPHATLPHATLPHATLPHASPCHPAPCHPAPCHPAPCHPAPCIPTPPPCPMPPCPLPPCPMHPQSIPMPPCPMPPHIIHPQSHATLPHATLPHATLHNPSPVPCHPAPCIPTPLPCPMHPMPPCPMPPCPMPPCPMHPHATHPHATHPHATQPHATLPPSPMPPCPMHPHPTPLPHASPCHPAPCIPAPCHPAPCHPAPCHPAPCHPAPCHPAPCIPIPLPCPMPPHIIHPQSHATLPHVSLPHVSPLHSPAPCIPMPPSLMPPCPMPPCPMPPCPMHPHATLPHATLPHATLPHATLPHWGEECTGIMRLSGAGSAIAGLWGGHHHHHHHHHHAMPPLRSTHRCQYAAKHAEEEEEEEEGLETRAHQGAEWSDAKTANGAAALAWAPCPPSERVRGPRLLRAEEWEWSRSSSFSDGQLSGQPERQYWEPCQAYGGGGEGSFVTKQPVSEELECSSCLEDALQDTVAWLSLKDEELSHAWAPGGDVATLQHQKEEHQLFTEEVKSRGTCILSLLESAQEYTSHFPSLLHTEDPLSSQEADPEEQTEAGRVWHQAEVMESLWGQLMEDCSLRERHLEAALVLMEELQGSLGFVAQELGEAVGVQEAWEPLGELLVDALQDHIDAIRLFEEELVPVGEGVRRANELVQQLSVSGVQLAPHNTQLLTQLNHQWTTLQDSIEVRLRDLQDAHKSFGASSQHFLSGSVQRPWERAISPNRVPYYINHEVQATSWDHPQMTDLYKAMANLNNIRFSAYRTAMKLRRVQKALRLDQVKLTTVAVVGDGDGDGEGAEVMDVMEVIHTLGALYEQQEEESGQQLDIPLCVDMSLNWLLNVYDSGRQGKVRVLSFKTGLVCLCNADIKDKCKYLFQQVCGVDGRCDRSRLAAVLTELMLIPRQLGEVAAFGGSNVEPSVASCFRMVPGKASVGLSDFLEWMALEPQSVVWLPLLQRVAQAESTLHQARCSVCRHSPIRGFRYRSLKQFNVDICQSCFLSGQALKGKPLHYPIIEYYTPSTSGEKMRDFAETLKNKFRSKQYFSKHPQRGYLPVQSAMGPERESSPASSPKLSHVETHSRIEQFANRLAQMEHQNCSFFNHSLDEDQYPLGSGVELEHPALHHLLSGSCSGRESQEELQQTIAILEDQNRILQREYRRLRWLHTETEQASPCGGGGGGQGQEDEALLEEARMLKQHRGRLQTRMHILEQHNQQLESQLHRLRTLLKVGQH
ncbi:dystrophin-related protein 2-like [Engraulis encrasicolus]|uniref:dystrophin-related protein 2-like n=1 Tax=Engraulis encrasicolus TaxID=184585 RepID=UPI002FD20145